jgi:hypothetical protein
MDKDDAYQHLNSLYVPTGNPMAVDNLLREARNTPRSQWLVFSLLRFIRAYLFIPSVRYAIVVGVVCFFILVGLVADPPGAPDGGEDYAGGTVQRANMLTDVDFPEEHWAEDFWSDYEPAR